MRRNPEHCALSGRTRLISWLQIGSCLPVLLAAGCAHPQAVDVLEARLRDREDQVSRLQAELARLQAELNVARRESDALREQLGRRGEASLLPEQAEVLFRAEGVKFHPLLTGGHDADGQPGDELLHVVLIPHDRDGELLKLPGEIALRVIDPSLPPERQQVAEWSFSREEARETWRRSLVGSGYHFRLPWPRPPVSSELVLHAQLMAPDGRRFDASRVIRITPPQSPPESAAPLPATAEAPHAEGNSRR